MNSKNLYISDENTPLWDAAEVVARTRHLSLSTYITSLLEKDLPFSTAGLKCVFCFNSPQAPGLESDAHFVVNGQSVCIDHARLAKTSRNFQEAHLEQLVNYTKDLAA